MKEKVSLSVKITSLFRVFVSFLIIGMGAFVFAPLFLFCLPWRGVRIKLGNIYGHIIGRIVLFAIGMRATVIHRERIQEYFPAIYLSNHSTALDPLIAIWICPTNGCGIAKKEIAHVPFFGQIYYLAGHLLIDKSNPEKAIASLNESVDLIKKYNLSLWIWPEGTRSITGRMLPLKKGFAHLAIASGLPIVPIVVRNGHKRWPAKTYHLYPGKYEIEILPKVDTSHWTKETLNDHIAEVQQIYNDALPEEQKLLPNIDKDLS